MVNADNWIFGFGLLFLFIIFFSFLLSGDGSWTNEDVVVTCVGGCGDSVFSYVPLVSEGSLCVGQSVRDDSLVFRRIDLND